MFMITGESRQAQFLIQRPQRRQGPSAAIQVSSAVIRMIPEVFF
jgi:hypothetical protein